MEGYSRNDEIHPQWLDLIPKDREWTAKIGEERNHGIISEEKKLELRLGPPGDDEEEEAWTIENNNIGTKNSFIERDHHSLLYLGYFSKMANNTLGSKRGFLDTQAHGQKISSVFPGNKQQQIQVPSYLSSPVTGKESSQPCCNKLVVELQSAEKKTFSPDSANTAVTNTSQKRSAPAPVVGWPPIRSFRKNLASSGSSKLLPESPNVVPFPKNAAAIEKQQVESSRKVLFVKINMDGVPIGRKVDLKAYESYENLSSAVDQLFRGLLAAQRDSSAGGIQNGEGEKAITGLLDGSGEYTLVYEDNEGDRMLVGDVPWHMFVSTVKRLRVLKSSELAKLFVGSKQEKNPL
ncbi:hypothetical protein LguiB_023254 [Lonicera macranthoides]